MISDSLSSFPDQTLVPIDDSPARLPSSADARDELLGLVIRAQAGDLSAQSDLVRRYMKRISAHVRNMLYQTDAVEDIVQMVFIKMARRITRLREPITFESWLFTLARNTTIDFLRQVRARPAMVSGEWDLKHTVDPTPARALPEIMEALEVALTRLSPRNQSLVRMVVQGFSYEAIAQSEGLTIGAVKLRLNRVRPFLRASIRGEIGRSTRATRFGPPVHGRTAP
jgi:RNA polymerase sigma factor (sigma-70 family)